MAIYQNDDDQRPIRYAARQPILTAQEKVIGYKLLFRTDVRSVLPSRTQDNSDRTTIDITTLLGLNTLCDNRLAFIHCTHDLLTEKYLLMLPPDKVVAEVAASVAPSQDTMESCRQLKMAGYRIALHDFVLDDRREPMVALADFIKVDIEATSVKGAAAIAARYRNHHCGMIAEKVETREQFNAAHQAGFHFFQGYFFRRPETTRSRGLQSNQAIFLQLLRAVGRPELDWHEVEAIIKQDATLYYRLLRYLNSAAYGMRGAVRSVIQALTLLGENEFRRWCRLAGMLEMSQNRPSDLILAALIRAKFSELISVRVDSGDSDLFLMGLLSLMDSLMELPMATVIEGLPLDEETRLLLLEHKGSLYPVYELILAVEAGHWPAVVRACLRMGIEPEFVARCHWNAMAWAQSISAGG